MAMIEMIEVSKRFADVQALDALTISVPQGAVYGLLGPNGAGKSTAIRHITGMLRPDAGEVLLGGEPVWENPNAKKCFFCIPDEPWYFPAATTKDMMRFIRNYYPRFDAARYEKLKEAFPLDEKRPIRRMSRGMQKQSAFWLALSAHPEVLILDEPVDGLDPVMRRTVWSLVLGDVAEHGMTVLVSSHNLRELEDVCDHVGLLQNGRCVLERPLSEMQENTAKVQLVLPEGTELPEGLELLHKSASGRLQTLILRGKPEELLSRLQALSPVYIDAVPLSLEEIFIYELGGENDAFSELLL